MVVPRLTAGAAGAPPEHAPSAEEGVEDVLEGAEVTDVRIGGAAQAGVAVTVVDLAGLRLAQHLVGLGDLLEALLRGRIVRVHVGVELPRQPAERLLDRLVVGVAGNAKDLVVVAAGGRHGPKGG